MPSPNRTSRKDPRAPAMGKNTTNQDPIVASLKAQIFRTSRHRSKEMKNEALTSNMGTYAGSRHPGFHGGGSKKGRGRKSEAGKSEAGKQGREEMRRVRGAVRPA